MPDAAAGTTSTDPPLTNEARSPCPAPWPPPIGITNPPIDDLLTDRRLQVRPGHLLRQARPPDQRLLLPAQEGLLEYVGPLVETAGPREAAVDRAARDQRGPADLRADRGLSRRPARPRGRRLRVVLGVGGGIAAYKACLAAAAVHRERATTSPSCRPRRRCEFVGAPTWAALSGKPVAHRGLGRRPRGAARAARAGRRPRRRRAGHRRPAGPGRARPGRRPADHHPAHRPLPGRVRPGDAHRDVGAPGHPGQRRTLRARGVARHRARRRAGSPARTPARAGCPSPRSCIAALPRASLDGVRAASGCRAPPDLERPPRRRLSAGGTREPLDPVRFLGNRSSGKQGVRPRAVAAAARGATVTLVAANDRRCPAPDGRRRRAGRDAPWSCRRRCRRRPRTPTSSSWPPRRPTSARRATPTARSRSRTTPTAADAPRHRAGREPRHPRRPGRGARRAAAAARSSSASPPRPATRAATSWTHARAKLARKGCDLLVVNEVGRRQDLRHRTTTRVHILRRRLRRRDRRRVRPPRRRSPPRCGTPSRTILRARG